MKTKINKIKNLVKLKYEPDIWKYHIIPVLKYAMQLAQKYKADKEVVELSALLHDIGRIGIKEESEHHLLGVPIAEKILQENGFSIEVIKQVKHCIESHRTGKGSVPATMSAKIVANADAMAHFDILPMFFYWCGRENKGIEQSIKWAEKKLKKDWDELTLPEAKKIVRKKYETIQAIFNNIKDY